MFSEGRFSKVSKTYLIHVCRTLKEGLLEDIQSQFPEIIADYKALRPAGKQEEAKEVAAAAAAKT